MKDNFEFSFKTGVIGYPIFFVLIIWLVFWAESRFGFNLNYLGVYPRSIAGLQGILFSPFIHSGISHLWNNTLPLLILSTALFYFYSDRSWAVLGIGMFATGALTWLIGRPSLHIGASGIIYMLFSFLFFKGIITKHYRLIALSFSVVFMYGSMLWYVFPIKDSISWEGHLSGLLTGFILALLIKNGIIKQPVYTWEQPDYDPDEDVFMRHFDENGNFIELAKEEVSNEEEKNRIPDIQIVYEYKEQKKD
ncbi:rhomboid family intramembrane serine protease [Aquimarina sp. W85]|uniref:rhomboid family intramembrane serine protease n=1 Tax=Aquimarina rhodophyticola TaxID=3342246 RepID=UPI00366A723D